MSEQNISLDGTWEFAANSSEDLDVSQIQEWRSVIVPRPWQAQFEDLRNASGTAWYRRHFIDRFSEQQRVLRFCILAPWIITPRVAERQLVGEHEGGYLPFEFDIRHGCTRVITSCW